MPTEDEQYEVYAGIVKNSKAKHHHPLVDLGVDKNPRWFGQNSTPTAASTRTRPDRHPPVPCRAGHVPHPNACHPPCRHHGPVRMMWPMITSISEVRQCLIHLDTAQRQLDRTRRNLRPGQHRLHDRNPVRRHDRRQHPRSSTSFPSAPTT